VLSDCFWHKSSHSTSTYIRKRVGEQRPHANPIGSCEKFVDAQPREQVRGDRGAILFLDRVQPVVDKIGRGAVNRLTTAATKALVSKAGRKTGPANARQLIPYIPDVGCSHPNIGAGGEIAVEVIGLGAGPKRGLLIVGVIAGGRKGRGKVAACERATGFESIPCCIIGVGQRPQRGRALLVGHGREFGGDVVEILDFVRVGIRHAGAAIRIVIGYRHRAGPLRDRSQAVGIVVRVDHLRLPNHRHRGSP